MSDETRDLAHVSEVVQANRGGLVQTLLDVAAKPDCDPAKAREIYAFAKEVMQDEAKREWTRAFITAKNELDGVRITKQGKIVYEGKNGKQDSVIKFLRYEDIAEAVKPILREHGLAASYTYEFTPNPPKTVCVMKLMHNNGHIEEFRSPPLPMVDSGGGKNDVQGAGSVGTYGRRYVVCPTFDIVADGEDDDGNLGRDQPQPITEEQLRTIEDVLQEIENREPGAKGRFMKLLVKEFKVQSIGELLQGSQLKAVTSWLSQKMTVLGMK